jgi:hypothetical protein
MRLFVLYNIYGMWGSDLLPPQYCKGHTNNNIASNFIGCIIIQKVAIRTIYIYIVNINEFVCIFMNQCEFYEIL